MVLKTKTFTNKANFKNILLLSFLIVFIVCCEESKHQIIVDNPTDFDVELLVNDERYTLYGLETIELNLINANHSFKVINKNDSLLFFKNIRINSDGIVNPFLATYIKWTDIYTSNKSVNKGVKKEIIINKRCYNNVNFEVYKNTAFIRKSWNYSLFEPWEESFEFYTKEEIIRSKIYRLVDIEKKWGYLMDIDTLDISLNKINTMITPVLKKLREIDKSE